MTDFDVMAIGAGAAGLTVGIGGAGLGLRVALVERHRSGGECTWTGCVPSKAILHVADVAAAARQAAAWSAGGGAPPQVDFARAIAHVRAARQTVGHEETAEALSRRGVTVLHGQAVVKGPGRLEVDGHPYTTRHIVVATGSDPEVPRIPGIQDVRYFTNETLFDEIETLPGRLAVVGGGPIGCEMAQAFARLGSQVTVFQSRDRLLPNDDEAVAPYARAALERDGVAVRTGAKITSVTATAAGGRAAIVHAEGLPDVEADAVLVAAGRRARTAGFGLQECGVKLSRNGVAVDEHLQTGVPGIWAIGDVVDPYRFTHVAEMQGRVVLRNILFPWKKQKVDYRAVPWATFIDPEIGHVGLTERQAREQYGRSVEVQTFPLSLVDRAISEGATEGFVKLVLRRRRILGAHIVAPCAGELVQITALAMNRRLPVGALSMVTVYPTYAYALHQAADRATLQRARRSRPAQAVLGVLRRLSLR